MEEVTRYYEEERLHDGILVVTQDATLSMPATVRDITLIRAFVPGGDVWRPDDTTNVVRIKIRLIDEELRKADPWKLVQGLHPRSGAPSTDKHEGSHHPGLPRETARQLSKNKII
jgi:hypothetical protein